MTGKTLKKEYTVTEDMLAEHVGSGSLPVLATPVVAALFEGAAAEIAQSFLPEGVTTVGTEIAVRHTALTPCGARLTVEAELTERTERTFRFRLAAEDEAGPVASGEHERVSVKAERFAEKARARKARKEADFDLVLFDLDGTLTDSGPGITDCVGRALKKMGKPVPPQDTLRRFIGPPLFCSFTELCGLTPEEADRAVEFYREFYRESGIFNNAVYDGIPETLKALHRAGARLAVATSKPAEMARTVLGRFDLSRYFDFFSAADENDRGSGKEELILQVLERAGCEPGRAVMIGDTKFDAQGARKAGTRFIGALYGFGTEKEMRSEGAEQFARTPADIVRLLVDKP